MISFQKRHRRIDRASTATLVLTAVLFGVALFEKGLTQEILLEAGVFLVSVKLVLSAHKSALSHQEIEEKLDLLLKRTEKQEPR